MAMCNIQEFWWDIVIDVAAKPKQHCHNDATLNCCLRAVAWEMQRMVESKLANILAADIEKISDIGEADEIWRALEKSAGRAAFTSSTALTIAWRA